MYLHCLFSKGLRKGIYRAPLLTILNVHESTFLTVCPLRFSAYLE
ncbi:hypothetical protein TREVI0001_1403 [Treponema vincentii ATCC 35580]|uniref:Uncharacterized protein n=1 Tax=Treponema vincentii ATCC 35580 TaxID=596324 RepID=C8PPU3_9SPIR|nr:hypothetical protein TREVI0001_1403 [Treponema vincentii ATCC 35580]